MRITYGSCKEMLARYAGNGLCADDPRVLERVNLVRERLMKSDVKWKGTVASFVTRVYDCCITLPREIQTIEGVSVCGSSVRVRNQWFEFLSNGPGISSCSKSFIDRGDGYPTFRDICGNRKIHVYTDVTEGGSILVQGFDAYNNEVRTQTAEGSWINGEYIDLSSGSAFSENLFSSISGIQKPVTRGYVRLYSYDPVSGMESAIGLYHPEETLPGYRRYELTGNLACGTLINVIGVLRYLPITRDSDYMGVENLNALSRMLIALEKEDNNLIGEAMKYQAIAEDILKRELHQYIGDAALGSMQVQSRAFGAGEILAIR